MLRVQSILGRVDEPRFADRRIERLIVASPDASKSRFRTRTEFGSDIAVDLRRGSYLEDGAVLADDGVRIVVVERELEAALIIRFSPLLEHAELVRHAALVGHAFGNQHVAIEVVDGEIRVPITTSRDVAAAAVQRLELDGAELTFALLPFGLTRRLAAGHDHHVHPHGSRDGADRHG